MKAYLIIPFAILSTLFLASCGSPNYFYEQESKRAPHAQLSLRNGATQILKINGKYAPQDTGAFVRLTPGRNQIEVATTGQQATVFSGLFGAPGVELSAQAIMHVDVAPGKYYRPESVVQPAGTYFFLRDENGIPTGRTRAYSSAY